MLIDRRAADSEVIGHLIDGHSFFAIEEQRQNLSLRIAVDRFQNVFPTALWDR